MLVGNGDPVGERGGSLPPFGAGDTVGPVSAAVGNSVALDSVPLSDGEALVSSVGTDVPLVVPTIVGS